MRRVAESLAARQHRRDYRKAHPRNRSAYQKSYRIANRARISEARRVYYAANLEKIVEYRLAHRLQRSARSRAWRASHPELRSHYENVRRARKFGNGGSHTIAEWQEKCALLGGVCFYCGSPGTLTRDHKTPLARGGSDGILNIVPACRPCNSQKQRRTAEEFLAPRFSRRPRLAA